MSSTLAPFLKEIARGRKGSRDLSRADACIAMQSILSAQASDLEIGAFCIAMRIKGESPEELMGFLDACVPYTHAIHSNAPVVVIPSYNGARRTPCLTPLLALLLAQRGLQEGFSVLLHGMQTEGKRTTAIDIFQQLAPATTSSIFQYCCALPDTPLEKGRAYWIDTPVLSPAVARLLRVRETLGLRNSAHSLVKLINPIAAPQHSLILSSYTHPEYRESVAAALLPYGQHALLLRGTEGEAYASTTRIPEMRRVHAGALELLQTAYSPAEVSMLPKEYDSHTTAAYIQAVLNHQRPAPESLRVQIDIISRCMQKLHP